MTCFVDEAHFVAILLMTRNETCKMGADARRNAMDWARHWKKLVIAALVLAGVALLFEVQSILPPFIVAFVLIYLLNPLVERLGNISIKGTLIGRGRAVAVVFISVFLVLGTVGGFVVPRLYHEAVKIGREVPTRMQSLEHEMLPHAVGKAQATVDSYGLPINLEENIRTIVHSTFQFGEMKTADVAKSVQKLIGGFFSAIVSVVLVFVVTMFGLLDWPRFYRQFVGLFPAEYHQTLYAFIKETDKGLAGAIRGQLIICAVNGALTMIGLMILNVKYAVTIGIIAGIFSVIPVFGSILSSVPAVLIGLTQSVWTALLVLLMICLIHLIEANFLNPKIMGDHTELHPIMVLFVLLIGEHFAGPVGLLLAVPLATVLRTILRFLLSMVFAPPKPANQ